MSRKNDLVIKKDQLKKLYVDQRKISDEIHHIERAKAGVIVCDECENHINLTDIDI